MKSRNNLLRQMDKIIIKRNQLTGIKHVTKNLMGDFADYNKALDSDKNLRELIEEWEK